GRPQVTVEYHWLVGQFDRLPALMADLMRRRVATGTSARVGARGRLHCRAGQSGQYPGFRKRATGSTGNPPRAIGLQIQVLKASTGDEMEAAFTTLVRDRADALYVAGDVFFTSLRVQFATLAMSYRIPATYPLREAVEAGGLMAYDTDRVDMFRQVG